MAETDIGKSTTTNLTNKVDDFSVTQKALDYAGSGQSETYWYFSDAAKNFGYYKEIPELRTAINILATWTAGKGWSAESDLTQIQLDQLDGWGEDTFQSIMENLLIVKKIVGDSFAEIVRNQDTGTLINLKPISPERMRLVIDRNGRIKRYDVMISTDNWKPMKREDILHLSNDRIGDEIHGNSVIDSCKWVIDALNEAMNDERKIKHRELALGVLYVDTDDTTKINKIKDQYAEAINKGEVLVLPKDTAELQDARVAPRERLAWIQYLQNFFYIAVGVPRIMATSEGFTEAGGKVGFLTFEPVYTREQTLLEGDLWAQVAVKVKFERPPSLAGTLQEDEEKNTGQVGFQPQDTEASITRE